MSKIVHYNPIVLRAGNAPEQQFAYSKECVDGSNPTGYIGVVQDVWEQGDKTMLRIECHVVSLGHFDLTFSTDDLQYKFNDNEGEPNANC